MMRMFVDEISNMSEFSDVKENRQLEIEKCYETVYKAFLKGISNRIEFELSVFKQFVKCYINFTNHQEKRAELEGVLQNYTTDNDFELLDSEVFILSKIQLNKIADKSKMIDSNYYDNALSMLDVLFVNSNASTEKNLTILKEAIERQMNITRYDFKSFAYGLFIIELESARVYASFYLNENEVSKKNNYGNLARNMYEKAFALIEKLSCDASDENITLQYHMLFKEMAIFLSNINLMENSSDKLIELFKSNIE